MPKLTKGRIKSEMLACNMCGRKLHMENGILLEDAFIVKKEWGYFSERDTEIHEFAICESCYVDMISKFKLPIKIREKHEVL